MWIFKAYSKHASMFFAPCRRLHDETKIALPGKSIARKPGEWMFKGRRSDGS